MDAALAAAPKLNLPSLILRGANDQLIEDGPTAIMLAELPKDARQPRRIARYRAGWHMLLRDLQAKTVWRDIKGWIEDPAAALGDSSPEKLKAIVRRKYKRDNSR
jgi:alpha-beta hydrolase superfamily lysophospholipase